MHPCACACAFLSKCVCAGMGMGVGIWCWRGRGHGRLPGHECGHAWVCTYMHAFTSHHYPSLPYTILHYTSLQLRKHSCQPTVNVTARIQMRMRMTLHTEKLVCTEVLLILVISVVRHGDDEVAPNRGALKIPMIISTNDPGTAGARQHSVHSGASPGGPRRKINIHNSLTD